jgi:hypothetical protein
VNIIISYSTDNDPNTVSYKLQANLPTIKKLVKKWRINAMEVQVGMNTGLQDLTYSGFLKCFKLPYKCQKPVASETQQSSCI